MRTSVQTETDGLLTNALKGSNVRYGSLADPLTDISLMSAFGRKADLTPTVFTDDLRPQWGPKSRVPPGANLLFLNLSWTPFVTTLQNNRGLFLKFFWELKGECLFFNGSGRSGTDKTTEIKGSFRPEADMHRRASLDKNDLYWFHYGDCISRKIGRTQRPSFV